jgi:diacylglycerol kinase (ATP)
MASPFGRLAVVANPIAGRGNKERGWPQVKSVLDAAGFDYEVTLTEGPGHATQAARSAREAGRRFVIAVGGDGTVHEVVNGVMSAPDPGETILGVVPAGSGCDFGRTFGLPQEPEAAAQHLLGDGLWGRVDLARLSHLDQHGQRTQRWFANIAEAGLGAEAVAMAARMPRWLGGSVYRLASTRALLAHKPSMMRITMHGHKARGARPDAPLEEIALDIKASMAVVANCQFYGGGMRVAPRAIPSDGLLDVLVFSGPKRDAAQLTPKLYKGEHVPNRNIAEYLASTITIEAEEPVLLEADGEVIGTTPATFEVVPDAISLKI